MRERASAGDGWRGRRYFFELTDAKDGKRGTRVTGTVDVDQAGRVRRLEVTGLTTDAGRTVGTFRTVMEFRDYRAHETVSAPPAGEVTRAPDADIEVKPVPAKARTNRPSQP